MAETRGGTHNDYAAMCKYMRNKYYQVSGVDFYKQIFPSNEESYKLDPELDLSVQTPNAVYLYGVHARGHDHDNVKNKPKMHHRIMLDDTWDEDYWQYVYKNPMALCSGIAYCGENNRLSHAIEMHALIIDLDGVGMEELLTLFKRFASNEDAKKMRRIPYPTYLVLSGSGVHLYYVFSDPVPMYPYIRDQIRELKVALTTKIWDYKGTSRIKNIQYQSINQAFRMVGSINEKYGTFIVAYAISTPVTIADLNLFVAPDRRVDVTQKYQPSTISLEEAKERYPDWYDRVVVRGETKGKKWDIAGKVHGSDPYALYHWWLSKADEVQGGHRYNYMLCLVAYAAKNDVPYKTLESDIWKIYKELRDIHYTHPLTKNDVRDALGSYRDQNYNYSRRTIERLSGIQIPENKRNGRPQNVHLQIARSIRDISCITRGQEHWWEGNGRPSAESTVAAWRDENPGGSKSRCKEETGLSYPTIRKWWESDVISE